jgi:hypothetical protein
MDEEYETDEWNYEDFTVLHNNNVFLVVKFNNYACKTTKDVK